MAAEDNKAAVLRFYEEVINGTDLDVIDDPLTPDGVDHTFGSQSAEEAKQFFGLLYQAFPDLRVEVNDVLAEGDLVAARVTYSGTHEGEFVGIPATGQQTQTSEWTSSGCRMASRPSIGVVRNHRPRWRGHRGWLACRLAFVGRSASNAGGYCLLAAERGAVSGCVR